MDAFSMPEIQSPRRMTYAEYRPTESKVCASCKRVRSMSKFSDFQFKKEFGDCLDCVYLFGKNRKAKKQINRNSEEFRLSALHASPRKYDESPRNHPKSIAHDQIIINTLEKGVKLFYELDKDCNGTISKSELIRGLSTNDTLRECLMTSKYAKGNFQIDPYTKLFNNIDVDASGTIDLQEFITMLKKIHHDYFQHEDTTTQHDEKETAMSSSVQSDALANKHQVDNSSHKGFTERTPANATLSKLSNIEYATKPTPEAVKRSQFKSPHRQYVEKKQAAARKERNEVKELNTWSTFNPSVDSTFDPYSAESTPRGEHRVKQFYTYQTSDGCLIMHERYVDHDHNTIVTQQENNNPTDLNSTAGNSQHEDKVHWEDISSIDLSDTRRKGPSKLTLLSGDCAQRKKVLCWKEDVDSSSDEEDNEVSAERQFYVQDPPPAPSHATQRPRFL